MSLVIFYIYLLILFQVYGTTYDGYKVLKITPKSWIEVNVLEELTPDFGLDIWTNSRIPESDWVMSIEPEQVNDFINILNEKQFNYTEINSNLGHTFRKEKAVNTYREKRDALRKRRRYRKRSYLKMDRFYSYDEIVSYMEHMENEFPSKVSIFTLGTTYEGNLLKGIKITNGDDSNKPIILIDGGIHAREWISHAMALYLMSQLIENDKYKYMLEKVDWYVVPVLNPDGYKYTMTTNRMWRKNRSPGKRCWGVDLNRNWNFHWGETHDESTRECDSAYFGPYAFSEPEVASYAKFAYGYRDRIKLYISFHSYGNMILYPWAYSTKYPEDANELHPLGIEVANAIAEVRGTKYTVGSTRHVLYKATGCSSDWMKAVARIPLSYILELTDSHGFDPPASKIKKFVQETFAGVTVFHDYVARNFV